MSKNTNIEWTDHTINFWWGCHEVSPACTNCYARDWAGFSSKKLFGTKVLWGKGKPRAERLEKARAEAMALNNQATKKGVQYRIFANSMSDWLDDEVEVKWLEWLLDTILWTPNLDWQLLTKRPENFRKRLTLCVPTFTNSDLRRSWVEEWISGEAIPPNVWIGTTVEDQIRAEQRIPELLGIPARVRFLSCEPLLGALDLEKIALPDKCDSCDAPTYFNTFSGDICCGSGCNGLRDGCHHGAHLINSIDWVICGGESGQKARPIHPDWVRSLRDQCQEHQIPFFFNQWGKWFPFLDVEKDDSDGRADYAWFKREGYRIHNLAGGFGFHGDRVHVMQPMDKGKAGRMLDGVEHSEIPVLKEEGALV